jgi:hypothetical protein
MKPRAHVSRFDRANVRMIQGRGSLGFAAETFQGLAILSEIIGKKRQGDEAIETGILGLVHDAHPATTEFLNDPVVRRSY